MQSKLLPHGVTPMNLNLGSGKDFRDDFLNLDIDDSWAPDAVCDLSTVDDIESGISLTTSRFGEIVLRPGSFDTIVANDVLEHVPDLAAMMTVCLALLRTGGTFEISVPYDLSYGAWQDPTHVRAFNERSWLSYTDSFWQMGWMRFRFALDAFTFVPSPLGEALKERGIARDDVLRTPRAIDSMSVTLRKVALSPEERAVAAEQKLGGTCRPLNNGSATNVSKPGRLHASESPDGLKAFNGTLEALRDRYCLWIVSPPRYTHRHAYDEIASALHEAFAELGGSAPIVHDSSALKGRAAIVFGPQLLPPGGSALLPPDSVLFNLEQIDGRSPWMSEHYLTLLNQKPVVDYSIRNHAALLALGVEHARLLPVGYAPGLTRITHAPDKDIDVLFYGSLNDRRRTILEALMARGAKVVHLFNVYEDERDAAIARAKIVLNVHFYEAAIFESVRVTYLLANGVCVVSEGQQEDPDLCPFAAGLALAPYHGLVDRCMELLANRAKREALAHDGLTAVKRRRQADLLRSLFAV